MSLNVVAITGRLTADPELRMTTNGNEVVNFRIAVDRPYSKDKDAQTADFFTVVAWNGTATFVSRYFSKGSAIAIHGCLQSRSYEDRNGEKRTAVEIVAREVSFCGGKNEAASPAPTSTPQTAALSAASTPDFEEIGVDDDEYPPF